MSGSWCAFSSVEVDLQDVVDLLWMEGNKC